MVIAVLPLELDTFGNQILAHLIVYVGLVRLAELVTTGDAVEAAVLDKTGAGLVETEGDVALHALRAEGEDPVVVAGTGIDPRLAAGRDLLDGRVQVRGKVDGGEHRRHDDALVLDGEREKDGETIVGHLLVLDGATHDDVVVAVAPIVGHALQEAVDALGEKEKPEVAAAFHHLPTVRAPEVGILQEEVGGEAGEDNLAALHLPRLVALALQREVEIGGLAALAARYLAAVHLVLPIDVAILAPRTYLGASMPRIPVGVYFPILGH